MRHLTTTLTDKPQLVSFDDYSKKYDMLLTYSPPYQQIGKFILRELKKYYQPTDTFSILDIGAGTGNFSKIVLDHFPNATSHLIEPNERMLAFAKHKISAETTQYANSTFQNFTSLEKYDVLLCIHALYLMPDSKILIPQFLKHMHPQSKLIVCDIGQVINVRDWSIFLFKENLKTHGLIKTIKIFKVASEIKSANREISQKQKSGFLWSHDLSQFKEWFSNYYQILNAFTCYRGCSNFLVCENKRY